VSKEHSGRNDADYVYKAGPNEVVGDFGIGALVDFVDGSDVFLACSNETQVINLSLCDGHDEIMKKVIDMGVGPVVKAAVQDAMAQVLNQDD